MLPDGSTVAGLLRFETIISAIEHSDTTSSDYILPGFVDLQVNGSHGVDVMTATADGILEISDRLAREGTTAWLPTAITSPIDRIENVHRTIGEAIERQRDAPRGARILGLHLEGPFISPLRLGAHPQRNLEPRGEAFERVMALEHLKLVTLAPELPGALEATRRLTSREVVVSIGHTNATFEEASAGVAAGARMFTHLFNAMRPLNHRDPGAIAAALTNEVAMPAVIPDGVHLAPEILRLIYMTRGARRMILTTDKVSLAGTESANISGGAARTRRWHPRRRDHLDARRRASADGKSRGEHRRGRGDGRFESRIAHRSCGIGEASAGRGLGYYRAERCVRAESGFPRGP